MTSMSERIWDRFLTERDKAVFAAGGFGARAGFGKRPALLVIDFNWAFCGEQPEPILESIKRWRTSCGEEAWTLGCRQLAVEEHARGRGERFRARWHRRQ
jgi:maleamate amidohydrolase